MEPSRLPGEVVAIDSRDTCSGRLVDVSRAPADTTRSVAPAERDVSPAAAGRLCSWCGGPIRRAARRDAKTCGTPCRQAAHRFRVAGAPAAATDGPMLFAYADPPYPGLAWRYYKCPEVDHRGLISRLTSTCDGWALSTSAEALQEVLALCPPGVRVCPWVRKSRAAAARDALNAWEPLIVYGGRKRREAVAEDLRDVLLWGGRQHTHPGALVGMKPAAFAEWMFRLLGASRSDTLVDVFPGSGAITRAWQLYVSEGPERQKPSRLEEARIRLEAAL